MIHRRSPKEIDLMRSAAKVLIETFHIVEKMVKPGIKTIDVDKAVEKFIVKSGARPAFKGYRGFPGSCCISIDEVVVHGIPNRRVMKEGQIVSVDIGVELNGYFADAARTFAVGTLSAEKKKLVEVTVDSLQRGIEQAIEGNRISDISRAIQNWVEQEGFSVVRDLVGHGIGSSLHESPEIPNYVDAKRGPQPQIQSGMVFAIEPMVNSGNKRIKFLSDGWTVVTSDRKPSAHFEHTVAITNDGPDILTLGR